MKGKIAHASVVIPLHWFFKGLCYQHLGCVSSLSAFYTISSFCAELCLVCGQPLGSFKVTGQWPGVSKYCRSGNGYGIQKKKGNAALVLSFCAGNLLSGMGCVPLACFWSESDLQVLLKQDVCRHDYFFSGVSRHLEQALYLLWGLKGLSPLVVSDPGNFFFFCFPRVLGHTFYKKQSTVSDPVPALERWPRKSLPPMDKSSLYVAYSFELSSSPESEIKSRVCAIICCHLWRKRCRIWRQRLFIHFLLQLRQKCWSWHRISGGRAILWFVVLIWQAIFQIRIRKL